MPIAAGAKPAENPVIVVEPHDTLVSTKRPAAADPTLPPPAPEDLLAHHDIVVVARRHPTTPDPLRALNATAFEATQKFDKLLIGPLAMAYTHVIPSPVRGGIHNFLYNLREPIVFANFVLQLKPGKAAETVGRFALNSTVGIGGVLDIAKRKPFHLPRRVNGFADTLGYYGVKNGAFLYLPGIGPTTIRDLVGGIGDRLFLPLAVGTPFTKVAFTIPVSALSTLDHRSDFDAVLHALHDDVPDAYLNSREFYLKRRHAEIEHLHGRSTELQDLILADPLKAILQPTPAPAPIVTPAPTPIPVPPPEPVSTTPAGPISATPAP